MSDADSSVRGFLVDRTRASIVRLENSVILTKNARDMLVENTQNMLDALLANCVIKNVEDPSQWCFLVVANPLVSWEIREKSTLLFHYVEYTREEIQDAIDRLVDHEHGVETIAMLMSQLEGHTGTGKVRVTHWFKRFIEEGEHYRDPNYEHRYF